MGSERVGEAIAMVSFCVVEVYIWIHSHASELWRSGAESRTEIVLGHSDAWKTADKAMFP